MTLEQTISRDAASHLWFHNNFNVIQRWCVTSTQRGMMATELRRLTGLQPEEQLRSQLYSSGIEKDDNQIQVIQMLCQRLVNNSWNLQLHHKAC